MGRKKSGKSPPPPFATSGTWHDHYLVMFDDQMCSPAYTALSMPAREVYRIICDQYKGVYTGPKVTAPYSLFEARGVRRNTASRAILELECFGFIRVDHGGLGHVPSVYHLIEDWKAIRTTEDVHAAKAGFKAELEKRRAAAERKKEWV